jgi:O-antigen/teichoic acid export membrane protein
VKRFILQARQSTFLRYNAIFLLGSVAVGVLNYLYYPVLGRMLPPAVFGEVQVLVSLFLQASIFLSVFGMVAINIMTTYKNKAKAQQTIFELEKLALFIGVVLLAATILAGEPLRQLFQFASAWPFMALALALLVSIPLASRSAYLRGTKRFGQSSIAYIIAAASKLVLSALFVLFGAGTFGAIGGIGVAQFLAFAYAALMGKRGQFTPTGSYFSPPHLPSVLPELRYAGLVCAVSLGTMLLFSVDVLIVKYLFDPEVAGLYAGVATVARIIFFLALPISQVLLPLVSPRGDVKANRGVLYKSLALSAVVTLPVLVICWFAPEWIISVLMGRQYVVYAELLPLLSLSIYMLSLANLVVMYHLTFRRWGVAIVVLTCAIIMFALMVMQHASPGVVVANIFVSSMSLLLLLGVWMLLRIKRQGYKR